MTDIIKLDLDTTGVQRGTDVTVTALNRISAALIALDSTSSAVDKSTKAQLADTLKNAVSSSSAVSELRKDVLKNAQLNSIGSSDIVAAETRLLKGMFSARIAAGVEFGNQELGFWKAHGVNIGGIRRAQLKEYIDNLKATEAAQRDDIAGYRQMAKLKAQSELDSAKALETFRAKSATPMSLDDTRAMLGMPSVAQSKAATEAIKAQMLEAQAQVEAKAKFIAKSATPMSLDDTRAMLGMPSRAEMRSFASQLESDMKELQRSRDAAARARIPIDMVEGKFTKYDAVAAARASHAALKVETDKLAPSVENLSSRFRKLSVDGNDVHSMTRGLASGFNLLWLTWGNLAPLAAGAAISFAFTRAIKAGAEFQQSLFSIAEIAGNSEEAVSKLSASVLAMGRSSQYGPLEAVKAIEQLTLAGLTAQDAMASLAPTLRFASVGGVGTKDAAETLSAVAKAYGFVASDFEMVSDVISKTAATTMASVEDMSEAFRSSTVVGQQFGVSLQDTANGLGMLAQIGIKGSSAGTAWKNMVGEMAKQSGKAAEAMSGLGVKSLGADGKLRNLIDVMEDMSKVLLNKTGPAQAKYMEALQNERGLKGMAAWQSAFIASIRTGDRFTAQLQAIDSALADGKADEAKKLRIELITQAYNQLREVQAQTFQNSLGMNFLADLENKFQPNQMLSGVKASLETTLVTAFKSSEDALAVLAFRIRDVFNSPEFQTGVSAVVSGVTSTIGAVASAVATLYEFKDAITAVGVAFVTYNATMFVTSGVMSAWPATVKAAASAYSVLTGTATLAAAAMSLAAVPLTTLLSVILAVGTAAGAVGIYLNSLGDSAEYAASKAREAEIKLSKDKVENLNRQAQTVRETIEEEIAKTEALLKAKREGLTDQQAADKYYGEAQLRRIEAIGQEKIRTLEMIATNKKLAASYVDISNAMDDPSSYAAQQDRALSRTVEIDSQLEADKAAVIAGVAQERAQMQAMLARLATLKSELAEAGKGAATVRTRPLYGTDASTAGIGKRPSTAGTFGIGTIDSLTSILIEEKKRAEGLKILKSYTQGVTLSTDELSESMTRSAQIDKTYAEGISKIDGTYIKLLVSKSALTAAELEAVNAGNMTISQVEKLVSGRTKLSKNQLDMLAVTREQAAAQLLENAQLDKNILMLELRNKALEHSDEVLRNNAKARSEDRRASEYLKEDYQNFFDNRYNLSVTRDVNNRQFDIERQYAQKSLELAKEKALELSKIANAPKLGPESETYKNLQRSYEGREAQLVESKVQELAIKTSVIYQQEWDKATSSIASNFITAMTGNTMNLREFMLQTFADMVLKPQLQLVIQEGFDTLLGGSGGFFASLMGVQGGAGSVRSGVGSVEYAAADYALSAATGGVSSGLGLKLPSFEGGGSTGNSPRSGGLDGKGGYLALVHPKETVIDHTKGGTTQAAAPIYVTINNTVGDVATKSMLDQYNAMTVRQIQAGLGRSAKYNGAMSRG